jgi:putative FmdB family regulatory protein
MPIYQYQCTDCTETSDVVRGINENTPDPICNKCNVTLKRVYSNIGVAFKGSGFYTTDKRR